MPKDIRIEQLKDVAGTIPVPSDLLTESILKKRRPGLTRASAAVATVAILLCAVVWFTPAGQAIKGKIKELVMTQELEQISPEEYAEIKERNANNTKSPSITAEFDSIPLGESIERTHTTAGNHVYKETATALTLKEALYRYPAFSVPTYLAPQPTTRVIVSATESRRNEEDNFELRFQSLVVIYDVEIAGQKYQVIYSDSRYNFEIDPKKFPSFPIFPGQEVESKAVEINGRLATALNIDGRGWRLQARHEHGMFLIHSPDLPLSESVKIMESLPETQ